jgi:sortase A
MSMPKQEVQGIDYIATLKIPALELDLPIISDWSYPNLKLAPCRYSGTAYLDNLVIAAHNYKSHFGNLKSLIPGDMVILTDMDGNEFRYEVAAIETLQPTAIEDMTSGDYALTLFTCTLSGSARVTVRCDRVE